MKEFIAKSEVFPLNVTVSSPVKGSLEQFEYIKLFLDSTLLTIVFFILILSAMLIYSLMVSDIDEKTYEMAMLRALGLRSDSLIQMILLQSVVFSVPGLCLGLIISSLVNILVRYFVFSYTMTSTSYFIATTALILGLCVGIIMPIFTNLMTVQRALSKKIRDSLDVFHTGVNDVTVKIIKLEHYGISLFGIGLGLILVV